MLTFYWLYKNSEEIVQVSRKSQGETIPERRTQKRGSVSLLVSCEGKFKLGGGGGVSPEGLKNKPPHLTGSRELD